MGAEQVSPDVALAAARAIIADAQKGHEPIVTPEGWVDCSCGWESNHVRLPSAEEQKMREAVIAFDAVEVPPAPYLPVVVPGATPTDQEIDDLRVYNDWQRVWGQRVRPSEPTDNTGDPDPTRTNDVEWQTHVISVGRDAAIAKHVDDGGTLADVPVAIATFGDTT